MKEIVCVIRPFDVQQSIYCMENDERLESVNAKLDTFTDTVISLMKKYQISSINMVGPKNFSEKYGKDISNRTETEYGLSSLNPLTIRYSSSKRS